MICILFRPLITGSGIRSASIRSNTGTVVFSGTSMATPAVAGVMALVREAKPDFSAQEVVQTVESGTIVIDGLNEGGKSLLLQVDPCMFQ